MTAAFSLMSPAVRLSAGSLSSVAGAVSVPTYDRSALTPAVVHIGVGGFHRAHQAVYLDELAERGHRGWGEVGVGLCSPKMRAALRPQDCLFTVVARSTDRDCARVVGSMTDYLFGPDSPRAVLDVLTDARTRVVTLTVTGDAYDVDDAGVFRAQDPAIVGDLTRPRAPRSMPGYLVEALRLRRAADLPAFTVVSCDNLPDNGMAARAAVVGLARLRDPDLADWIDDNAAFPSSMVDRITPDLSRDARRLVAERFGVRDRGSVVTEEFSQWVLEDDFCNGRPPLEEVGVQLVGAVAPYATTKKRLLNGAHSALAYLSTLAGHRTTGEAMADPLIARFVTTLMATEIAPLLPPLAGVDLRRYVAQLGERFSNTRVTDELARLCRRGSTKVPAYLLPSLVDARRSGRPARLLTLAVAGWFHYLRLGGGEDPRVEVVDPQRALLLQRAVAGGTDPRPLLAIESVFGDLGRDAGFVDDLEVALLELAKYGVAEVLRAHLSQVTCASAA